MSGWIAKRSGRGLVLIIALAFWGCSGGNSTTGEDEETELVAQTYNEQCALCHRSGSIAAVEDVHSKVNGSPQGEISAVTIDDGTGAVTIDFRLFDSENNLVPLSAVAPGDIRFSLAKLIPAMDGLYQWQSYLNTTETKAAENPGPAPEGNTTVQATTERANATQGLFIDNGDGTYTYQMAIDINNIISPLPVLYEPTRTHRVAMQVVDNVMNPIFDFVPAGGAPQTNKVVDNALCNTCHTQLAFHGGDRIQTDYCVTCHNPGSSDANSNNSVDFKVMVHKIHAGAALPEVAAGGEYAIYGFQGSKHDYSTVVYPQDLRNCTKCHDSTNPATPDGDNWKNAPSAAACTSCHGAPDAGLYPTFPGITADQIVAAHQIESQITAAQFEYNIISIANTNPGEMPLVTFSITDPTNSDAAYDIFNAPSFTAGGGASRVAILIGWPTTGYTNVGSENEPAQPVSINALDATRSVANGDGTYSVISPVALPAGTTGSGAVAIEGHPAGDFDGDGIYTDRIPVPNVVQAFPITEMVAEPRQTVVDLSNCKQCHGTLSVHGNNRTDNLQVCVICHNADATDINVRPPVAESEDGRAEQTIDFKYMIHAIHAGDTDLHGYRQEGIIVYGFGGNAFDFSEVRLPNSLENLRNCGGCHIGSSFTIPISSNVLPTTVATGVNLSNPDDDTNITPTASVCSSCHDSVMAKTHMSEEGALFDFVPFAPEQTNGSGDGEAGLCGPGPISAQPAGHTSRADCCSCHGFQ